MPPEVLTFHSSNRQGPCPLNILANYLLESNSETTLYAREIDFGWLLCRQPVQDTIFNFEENQCQVTPAWTAFNIKLQQNAIPRESSIGYCQVIEASPTEMQTVYTILQRSLQMANQLQQRDAIVVLDLAIYAKALKVMLQNKEEFSRIVLRLGTFHICAFMSAMGKRFGDAGLSDVLLKSGVVGAGSIAGVLEGRHYNRALCTHKVIARLCFVACRIFQNICHFFLFCFRLYLKHCIDYSGKASCHGLKRRVTIQDMLS